MMLHVLELKDLRPKPTEGEQPPVVSKGKKGNTKPAKSKGAASKAAGK